MGRSPLAFPNGSMPAALPAGFGQPQQVTVLATPFNDVQLLGMMAAQISSTTNDDARECARKAADLLFETIVEAEVFSKRIAKYYKDQAEANAPQG